MAKAAMKKSKAPLTFFFFLIIYDDRINLKFRFFYFTKVFQIQKVEFRGNKKQILSSFYKKLRFVQLTMGKFIKVIITLLYLLAISSSYSIETVSGACKNLLPYSIASVTESSYLTWYGKVGDLASGSYYEPGHLFERHVAVNNQCTAGQMKESKTVFIDSKEMIRTVTSLDNINCDLENSDEFNYRNTKTIFSASDYIDGIDCQTNQRMKFSKFYIQYKKTLQNKSPSQSEYMNSQKVTVWTVYPAR